MLNRKKRIHKIIKALKHKRDRPRDSQLLKCKLEEDKIATLTPRGTHIIPNVVSSSLSKVQSVWHDPQDNQLLPLPNRSMYRKLNVPSQGLQSDYESRVRQFYTSRHTFKNWATEQQPNILNQEQIYEQGIQPHYSVQFTARTSQRHNSIVTGLAWATPTTFFTTGYDQKLKVWSVDSTNPNPQLQLQLSKDIYIEGYPLTTCSFTRNRIYCGTLRKNYIVVDAETLKVAKITSHGLSGLKNYQHIRSKQDEVLLFANRSICLMDAHNCYKGSLLANEQLVDACFGAQYEVWAASHDCLYRWDTRMYRITELQRNYLAYTKVHYGEGILAVGNELGVVRLHHNNQVKEITHLVTYVTDIHITNQFLLYLSKWKQNAVRITHLQENKCVQQWPTVQTKLGYPIVGALSDGQFAIGSDNGFVSLFNVKLG